MEILKKVTRAICKMDGGEDCKTCDGLVQHFRGIRRDGTVHKRDRTCPYRAEADAAITALLEAAAEEGWRLVPEEATEFMIHVGMYDNAEQIVIARPEIKGAWHTMLKSAPEFEWDKET